MKQIVTILLALFTITISHSQNLKKPSAVEIQSLPLWAQKMYGNQPNVFEVDALYNAYYKTNTYVKSYHTQYYKRWRKANTSNIDDQGFILELTPAQKAKIDAEYLANQTGEKATNWSVIGPLTSAGPGGEQTKRRTNVYSFDQCAGQPNYCYLGTEPGEVYKSIDGGNNWVSATMTLDFGSGVSAVEVHPSNGMIVFAGGNKGIFKSNDGGSTWSNVLPQTNFGVNEILINPGNDQLVYAATDKGFYTSTNGGTTWNQVFTQACYDVKTNAIDPSKVYLLKNNPTAKICEFYSSTDFGATWNIQTTGWYTSSDPAKNDGGGRLAVSPANPNRIYAYLIGESKANDFGYIGVYRSNDGGTSWTLPSTPVGGPYTATHPNLAYGQASWTYHQGFYNCAIIASPTNADSLIIGGLNTWRSNDGGATFSSVSGYIGGPFNMHVDNQDFRVINNTTWLTTDGGIYKSTDFVTTQPVSKMNGVHGGDFWGFGSGWNEDVLVGGQYHNGNVAHHENYGPGNFLELGGGEAPTGYVNPGNNRKTYYSDISGKIIPINFNDPVSNFTSGMSPNESYYAAESSEMEFHPNCYSIAFVGNENKLWKSIDGGGSYNLVKEFGTTVADKLGQFEIASSNPDVMYVHQRTSTNVGKLWKTTNGGVLWNQLTIPTGNSRLLLIAVNPENENILWIAYPNGSNGNKVYESIDGGLTWLNITSPALNNEFLQSMISIAGTDKGLYVGTSKSVFYRNATTPWTIENGGLPTYVSTTSLKPFYKTGKIRMASYGKGIWQSNLKEAPSKPICRITVDKLAQTAFCAQDSFYFEDYSFLNHTNATWSWQFPTGSPATSSSRNPAVLFPNPGNHLAILTITDQTGQTDSDTLIIQTNNFVAPSFISEGFEGQFVPTGWYLSNESGGGQWSLSSATGGFGNSSKSALFPNYDYDASGNSSDLNIQLNTLNMSQLNLSFDVAHSQYGGQYTDSLEVLVSTDCGANYTSIYLKGGPTLATAPSSQTNFVPSANQWRTENLNLSAFVNHSKVLIAFRNWGHWGNNIYVDNVNIQSDLGTNEVLLSELSIYPNPLKNGELLTLKNCAIDSKISVLDAHGKAVFNSILTASSTLKLPRLAEGNYLLHIENSNKIYNRKLVIVD
jgi:photosystem II stability/assembly factor-like uncharacterized protein